MFYLAFLGLRCVRWCAASGGHGVAAFGRNQGTGTWTGVWYPRSINICHSNFLSNLEKDTRASFDSILQGLVWWRFLKVLGFLHIITISAGPRTSPQVGLCHVQCARAAARSGEIAGWKPCPQNKHPDFVARKSGKNLKQSPMLWTLSAYLYRYFKFGLLESYLASLTLTWFAYLNLVWSFTILLHY